MKKKDFIKDSYTKRHVARTLVYDHRMGGTAILERFDSDEIVERIEAPAMWEQMCFKPDRIKGN